MERSLKYTKLRSRTYKPSFVLLYGHYYCFDFIFSIPLIIHTYHEYVKTKQALTEIIGLRTLVKTANQISKERAPSNQAMASQATDLLRNVKN